MKALGYGMAIYTYLYIHASGILKSLHLFDQTELFCPLAFCQLLELCATAYSGNVI